MSEANAGPASIPIQRMPFTPLINAAELYFHNELQATHPKFISTDAWLKRLSDGRIEKLSAVLQHVPVAGRVLDLGAGCCWLSAEISKRQAVSRVDALEPSEALLTRVAEPLLEVLNARCEKIHRVVGDFHRTEFPDAAFDAVIASAALHHATDLGKVLAETRRILKPGGVLLGLCEPIFPNLPGARAIYSDHRAHVADEVHSVELSLSLGEWRRAFQNAGFAFEHKTLVAPSRGDRGIRRVIKRSWLLMKCASMLVPASTTLLIGRPQHSDERA